MRRNNKRDKKDEEQGRSRRIVLVICLVLCVYLFSCLSLIFNAGFYNELGRSDEVTGAIVRYFVSSDFGVPVIASLTGDETSHLRDVKLVIVNVELLLVFLLIVVLLLSAYVTPSVVFWSGVWCVVIPLFGMLPFEGLFYQFHLVVFPQGNWQFDPSDTTLVNIYPEEFFRSFFLHILARSGVVGLAFIVASRLDWTRQLR